jgi:hypothetical protein
LRFRIDFSHSGRVIAALGEDVASSFDQLLAR